MADSGIRSLRKITVVSGELFIPSFNGDLCFLVLKTNSSFTISDFARAPFLPKRLRVSLPAC